MSGQAVSVGDIISRTGRARDITDGKVRDIQQVNANLRMLAFNALIEAKRVGDLGAGFGVVADEVKSISAHVDNLAKSLTTELGGEIESLESLSRAMAEHAIGTRLTDLSLNAVELIDRNLYERTCDVRWWATDSAVVDALADPTPEKCAYASERLGVILDAYTVYLDLWLCDMHGNVIANGRPGAYSAQGANVSDRAWYRRGHQLSSGDEYAVDDVTTDAILGGAQIASYAASVRENGRTDGRPLGVLGIHFDWEPQAKAIVEGVRLTPEERSYTRALLVDSSNRVIASSDGMGVLTESLEIRSGGEESGYYTDREGNRIAFHRTPGYETYEGLGWHGVLVQKAR